MSEYNAPPPPPEQPGMQPGATKPGELLDRFLARLIDGLILVVVQVILTIVLVGALIGAGTSGGAEFVIGAIFTIITVAIQLGYYVFLETSRGQTVGKMVMKLKVVGPDGHSLIDPVTSVKRNFWYLFGLAGILPFVGILGSLAILAAVIYIAVTINNDTVKRQGFHDNLAGGTQVLKVG